MKRILYFVVLVLLWQGCSTNQSGTWRSDDLEYIPLQVKGEAMSLTDLKGKKIANGLYMAGIFRDGVALVYDTAYRFIDKKGEMVGKTWESATFFNDGVAWAAEAASPLSIINKKGEKLVTVKDAETALAFNEGLAVYSDQSGNIGVVDKKGKIIVSPVWKNNMPYYINGVLAVADDNGKWGLINDKGKIVIDCQFDQILGGDNFGDYVLSLKANYLIVCKEKRWGVVDLNGNFLINPQFDELYPDGDWFLMKKGKLYGWCDAKGKYVINPQFKDVNRFGESEYAPVENNDYQWGYIDRKGQYVINPQYNTAGSFFEDIAVVKMGKEWGAINDKGEYVINPQFASINDFWHGKAIVKDQGTKNYGIVDKTGKYLINPEYLSVGKDYLLNRFHLGENAYARSLYVDFDSIAGEVAHILESVDLNQTAGELKSEYSLPESAFSKKGNVVLFTRNTIYSTKLILKADCNAWQKLSDGWFGYTYKFKPDAKVEGYFLTVELEGKAARQSDIFRKKLSKLVNITGEKTGNKTIQLLSDDDEGQMIFGIDPVTQ